jgi:N-acetylneuraminate lyase
MELAKGFYTALVTPYDSDDALDPGALHAIMERNLKEGASGFLIGGSSTEAFLLSHDEWLAAFKAAADFARCDKVCLIAAFSAFSTEEAVAYARRAKGLGYDAVISTPPCCYKYGCSLKKKD